MIDKLTKNKLSKLLRYDYRTGRLFWLPRNKSQISDDRCRKIWNIRFANKEALSCIDANGYKHGRILGKTYRAHRIIWVLVFGSCPNQIDHIDGNPSNNKLNNLRNVSSSENQKNMKLSKLNKTGKPGVRKYKDGIRWKAEITVNRKNKSLGLFETKSKAIEARCLAEKKYNFHQNHGRS